MTQADEPVRLTILPNEPIAEMVCEMLRADGIVCMQRITNIAFGGGGELPSSGMGPREILVRPDDLERARELLASEIDTATDGSDQTDAS